VIVMAAKSFLEAAVLTTLEKCSWRDVRPLRRLSWVLVCLGLPNSTSRCTVADDL
jgi:hypothetical protein